MGYPDFTEFTLPVRRGEDGYTETKQVVVSVGMLPIMADIIEKATQPVLLTKAQAIRVDPREMTEESLAHIRESVARFLHEELRAHAIREGLAVITEPTLTESVEGGMLAFRCTATGMPLLQKGIQR